LSAIGRTSNGAEPPLESPTRLVRDDGFVASLEVRVPIWTAGEGLSVQLAPFFDYGRSWNVDRGQSPPREICSVGIGLRTAFTRI